MPETESVGEAALIVYAKRDRGQYAKREAIKSIPLMPVRKRAK
jgi:hypothetical protein